MKKWMIVIVLLALILPAPAAWAQAPEGQEYIVKAGDVLNKVAEEYLGDPQAYPEIVDATNLKAEEDLSYAPITNPNIIEISQKLWIPTSAEAVTELTAEATATPTPEPAVTVTETEVFYYVPDVPESTQEGSCWTSSFSTPTGWRCMVGNSIYDPCLIATDGKTVVCGIDTPGETEFALKLTEPLPQPDAPADAEESPYKIELADGTICGFMTGATVGYDDKRMNYGCDDEAQSGIFGDIQEGTVWMAERVVGEMTDDGFKPTQTQMIPLSKVWFMGPDPAAKVAQVPTVAPTKAPTAVPTKTPTVAPTEVPIQVTRTDVIHYVPDVPESTQEGSCWTSSISTPTGYRCTVGNSIYDPCLIATDGTTVVCGLTSPHEQPFTLKLTEALPELDSPAGAEEMPFRLDLANSAFCNFATGTVIPVGDNVIQYYCSDKYGILDNIQQGIVWEVNEVLTGDMDANGKVEVKDSRTMAIAKVWYGPEVEEEQEKTQPTAMPTQKATAIASVPSTALVLAYAGEYKAALPAASSPGRDITLILLPDGTIEWITDYMNGKPPIVEVGTWESSIGGMIKVTVTGKKDQASYDKPETIEFKRLGPELTAIEYDETLWGSEGITLNKQ